MELAMVKWRSKLTGVVGESEVPMPKRMAEELAEAMNHLYRHEIHHWAEPTETRPTQATAADRPGTSPDGQSACNAESSW